MSQGILNGIRPPGNSFVLPRHKIVYMSVTKVACTSLRWMIADLAGERREDFYPAIGAHETRLMTIHGPRDRWQHSPQLKDLSEAELSEISTDNGWLVFAVVRDPWSRLWSAWQSKFLARHAFYTDHYLDEPWFPRLPTTPEGVVEDFRAFVLARPWETHEILRTDRHFRPQVESVRPAGVNYSKIYDLRELPTLFSDVRSHLARTGLPSELYTPRANQTPLPLVREVLSPEVTEVVDDAYRADFEAFDDKAWSLDRVTGVAGPWSDDAIAHAAHHAAANERIGDLRAEARRLRRQLDKTLAANERLRRRAVARRPPNLARRALRKLRG